jgi:hypothetical protein
MTEQTQKSRELKKRKRGRDRHAMRKMLILGVGKLGA